MSEINFSHVTFPSAKGIEAAQEHAHSKVWLTIWREINDSWSRASGILEVVWMRAHLSHDEAVARGYSIAQWTADIHAKKGANYHSVSKQDFDRIKMHWMRRTHTLALPFSCHDCLR